MYSSRRVFVMGEGGWRRVCFKQSEGDFVVSLGKAEGPVGEIDGFRVAVCSTLSVISHIHVFGVFVANLLYFFFSMRAFL